jgi:hypothetical protein
MGSINLEHLILKKYEKLSCIAKQIVNSGRVKDNIIQVWPKH